MIEASNDDKHEGASLFPSTELNPSSNFVPILQEMLEAGMVGAILESRKTYSAWFDRLEGEAADEVAEIFSRLAPLEAIEAEYGFGAALDLNHRLVKKLVEWDQLGSLRHRNALTFAASRCPH